MSTLKTNQKVKLTNGAYAVVEDVLGAGGQGIVYKVNVSGRKMALKWYKSHPGTAFYNNMLRNVTNGSPAPNFLWPMALTEVTEGSFGYVMELRPQGYEDLGQFMLLKAKFSGIEAQLRACIQLCNAFRELHIRGLSYQDMNDGNFFINPKTGDVLICDNDNVAPDGTNTGILGTAGYMAPEVVEGKTMPNRYTDYYSLAVCLFILIYMNRPFEGKWYLSCPCDNDPGNARRLFGFDSVFCMDPDNDRNRPVPGVHNNVIRRWGLYPSLLGRAFQKTFSHAAIIDPTQRLMEKQWYGILLQVRSMFVKCPHCGKQTFAETSGAACAFCGKGIDIPVFLKVGRFTIPLVESQPLYGCMVSDEKDQEAAIGGVVIKGGRTGLRNTSDMPWTVTLPDGQSKVVTKGSGMPAERGFRIRFGQNETGEII